MLTRVCKEQHAHQLHKLDILNIHSSSTSQTYCFQHTLIIYFTNILFSTYTHHLLHKHIVFNIHSSSTSQTWCFQHKLVFSIVHCTNNALKKSPSYTTQTWYLQHPTRYYQHTPIIQFTNTIFSIYAHRPFIKHDIFNIRSSSISQTWYFKHISLATT